MFSLVILSTYITTITLIYNHKIFVEKNPEYIWGGKKLFGREMINIDKNVANKVQGIFGFPQRRGWERIADLYKKGCLTGTYATNEKARIPAFYIPYEPVADQGDVFEKEAHNIILVESPVSWYYKNLKETPNGYTELETFYIGKHTVTRIFGTEEIYTKGQLFCE